MIYLIGGPPRCGKTTVARRLAQWIGVSYVSLDYIQSIAYHYMADAERNTLHPLFPEETNDELYAHHAPADIIANYRARAQSIWPAMNILIHFALADNVDLVLEGYHIEPRFLQELMPLDTSSGQQTAPVSAYQAMMIQRGTRYALAHAHDPRIKALFLYREDVKAITTGLMHATGHNDWVLRQQNSDATLRRIATMVSQYSHYIHQEAEKYHCTAITMDPDFHKQTNHAVDVLTRTY